MLIRSDIIKFLIKNKPKISFSLDNQIEITFVTSKSNLKQFQALKDEEMTVEVKKFSKKRSLSQNSYMWVLIDKISEAVNKSREDVYKSYVRDYGVFNIIPIKENAVERFVSGWGKNGLGWFCEDLGESKLKGYCKLIAFFGTSTYTSEEMNRILDAIILDCEEMGIETLTLSEAMLLKNENDIR